VTVSDTQAASRRALEVSRQGWQPFPQLDHPPGVPALV
jgi:hypothetical protein